MSLDPAMSTAFIGVDVGTGSARAGVFDSSGRLLGVAKRTIAIWRDPDNVVEQSSADIWRAVTEAVREAIEASGLPRGAHAGLGFAATCSLIALDERLQPLSVNSAGAPERDVIVWMDHRAAEDAARINAAGHEVLRYAGGALSPEMQTPKLVWLARAKPEIFGRAAHFLGLTDWLAFRATGSLARSLCTVACKFGYLAHERRWPGEFFDSVDLHALSADGFARLGADIVAPGTPLALGLTAESADAMGLDPGTPVGAGLIDAHAGALGTLGAQADGKPGDPQRRLALILGTSSSCMAVSDEPRFIDAVWGPHFSALTPGQWLMDGGQSAFGAAIDRLMRLHPAYAEASAGGLDALESGIVARAGGISKSALLAEALHVLPSFIGRRAPAADVAARGGIVGLDLRGDAVSLEELYVAGLCGLAYGIADIVGAFERAGYDFETIVVSGGAAQSALVRQIVADACGKPVSTPETPEPVLLGSSMIGAVAAGKETLRTAMGLMSALAAKADPAGGPVAAFHARKRRALAILERAECEVRKAMRAAHWPEVVIFDCDGVLVDSEVISLGVTRRMLAEAGLRLSDDETSQALPRQAPGCGASAGRSRTRRPSAQRIHRRAVARDPCDVRARPERRRGRPAGRRRARWACLRRLLERARAAALRVARDGLRVPLRAEHLLLRRGSARQAPSRPLPIRGALDGRGPRGLSCHRGQRRGRRGGARRRHEGVRLRRRQPLLGPRPSGGIDGGGSGPHFRRHGAAAGDRGDASRAFRAGSRKGEGWRAGRIRTD